MKGLINTYIPESLKNHPQRNGALTLLFIALIMLLVEYYGWQGPFLHHLHKSLGIFEPSKNELMFKAQVFTSMSFFIFFFFLPFLFHLVFPMDKSSEILGLKGTDGKKALKDYAPLVLIMLPVLWVACSRPSFYKFYPLYNPPTLKMFLLYELVYLTQFFSVEFFFRGFGLFKMERLFPGMGVFIMVIPYSFVHIHKPFGEALGSIIAGIVLGHLALKSRSIWPGVIVHGCIALSADLFSMIHSGRLQNLF